MNGILVLVRHGQSDWNLKNLFTGWQDPDLTARGIEEARCAGIELKQRALKFDYAYTSLLKRAQHTLQIILTQLDQVDLIPTPHQALNERDYGNLTGLNKEEAIKKWGMEQVLQWRRSYDIAPPGGESLRDTLARVLPYYMQEIQPLILSGKHVLIAAHGNSLRALIMVLEGLSPQEITQFELHTGQPVYYEIGSNSRPIKAIISRD